MPRTIGTSVPRRRKGLLVAGLLVPALICTVVALATPSPLRVQVVGVTRATGAVRTATVVIDDTGGEPIRPHFLSRVGTHPSFWWHVVSGPVAVDPGRSARFVITPDKTATARLVARSGARADLMTLSDGPETLTTTPFPA